MKAFNQCFLFIKLLMRVIDCMVNLLSFEKWSKKSQSVFVAF